MPRPEWCDYCARDQKCANEDYQGNGSCAERIALWDEAFAAGAAQRSREVMALISEHKFSWTHMEMVSDFGDQVSTPDAECMAHALLDVRKLCAPSDGGDGGGA